LFDDRLGQAMAMAQRDRSRFALLYLDLDKFKPVNDSHGHGVGDLLLKQVAQRIVGCVRESDTVARIGGDEFVIILRAVSLADSAAQVAENIRQALEKPFFVDGHELSISCSIGVAIYPDDATSELELAQCADNAMYRAKEAGRNAVVLSNPV
jgi:diguanylate cyclase (GGDEF)-like protein